MPKQARVPCSTSARRERAFALAVALLGGGAITPALAQSAPSAPLFKAPQTRFTWTPVAAAAADVDGDHRPDLFVGTAGGFAVALAGAGGQFGAPQAYSTWACKSLARGDLDGDGAIDFVGTCANSPTSSLTVSAFRNDGVGHFTVQSFGAGFLPRSIALADFDADGVLDVAVACEATKNMSLLRGNGAGAFLPAVSYAAGNEALSLVATDLDGDGDADVALADGQSAGLRMYVGDGAGGIGSTGVIPTPTPNVWVSSADADADGDADLVCVPDSYHHYLAVLRGDGAGAFAPELFETEFIEGLTASFGDFDGDGATDLLSTFLNSNGKVIARRGAGPDPWRLESGFPCGAFPHVAVAVDIDPDGRDDALVVGSDSRTVTVLRGDPDALLAANMGMRTPVGWAVRQPVAGDWNGDGLLDLAATGYLGLLVAHGDGGGGFGPGSTHLLAGTSSGLIEADLDADGDLDLVRSSWVPNLPGAGALRVALGDGQGAFAVTPEWGTASNPAGPVIADMTGDGRPDVVTSEQSPNGVALHAGDGAGWFAWSTLVPSAKVPGGFVVRDFDHDGALDVAVFRALPGGFGFGSELALLHGDGSGGLVETGVFPTLSNGGGLAAGHLDDDGWWDLVAVGNANPDTAVLLGKPNGFAAPVVYYGNGSYPSGVEIGDLDGNGTEDLAVSYYMHNRVGIWHGDGTGKLLAPSSHAVGVFPAGLQLADFDADGRQDMLTSELKSQTFTWLENQAVDAVGLTPFGSGTSGCSGALGLSGIAKPAVGNAQFALFTTNAPRDAIGWLVLADVALPTGADPLGLGVAMHVDVLGANALAILGVRSDASGAAHAALPIPASPSFAGAVLYAQSLWIEIPPQVCTASPLGLVSSRALRIEIQP